MVIAKLQDMYPGAVITVDSARLRILGGIQVNELRMSRRDDPDRTEFFHVPSAIIYHDKEKISQGQLTLRKIELNRPGCGLCASSDGTWNLQEIISDRPPEMVLPTVVWHHGTIVLEDQQSAQPATPIEINDVNLELHQRSAQHRVAHRLGQLPRARQRCSSRGTSTATPRKSL